MAGAFSIVDDSWELIDPNPDIHELFAQYNDAFFWGKLGSVYVQWSPRMTLCAGLCRYHGRNRECSIHLSKPLLSLRPRKDLVETLLHEMIHAYLFVATGDRERESHGPMFHEHMYRINKLTGTNITVYHSFNDEVAYYKTHWWKCDGPCQHRPPFYGIVKRAMNRAPGPNDWWFKDHQSKCGGKFIKIKEPSPKKGAKRKKEASASTSTSSSAKENKITKYFTPPEVKDSTPSPTPSSSSSTYSQPGPSLTSNYPIEPFAGQGVKLGSSIPQQNLTSTIANAGTGGGSVLGGNTSQPPRRGEHPLLAKWIQNYKYPAERPVAPRSTTSSTVSGSGNVDRTLPAHISTSSYAVPKLKPATKSETDSSIPIIQLD